MLWNVVNPPKNLPAEDISGLSTAQTLELCDPEVLLFHDPLQNSEVTSTSNCCQEDTGHFFKTTDKNGTEITAATTDGCSLPELIFDNDIYVSTDFALSSFIPPIFPNNYQEDQLSLLDQSQSLSQEAAVVNGLPAYPPDDHFAPIVRPGPTILMPSLLKEGCLSLMPANSYIRLSSFLGSANTVVGPYLPCNLSSAVLSDDNSGIFNGSTDYVGTRLVQNQDLEVLQGDNGGIFSSDPLPGIYDSSGPLPGIYDSSTVLQAALSNERQHAVNDGGSSTPLDTGISSLEDSAIKAAAKCSVEERKDKIHRYLKKRNERNFSKKIKYACRKALADRRPRVRGRFARNDEFVCHETPRGSYNGNNEEDTDENSIQVVAEEDGTVDSSNFFAHLGGVDSFKCNHPTQSTWI
ncbi:uncharacterized protein LOC131322123 isoform X2 [Rhododendron vialii]|uniref:uncharacterized protein LOC131322123 isoform X2 n=1 Tax=Rhododendron vialii TaxID=182163 RepID=UPI00265F42B7|nr:uncharacterized protein LOC131322123 isoform X2 [Rhododendron vialii]